MADQKITQLNENTTPAASDVLAIVDDPGGTPETQKITYANLTDHAPKTHASDHVGATDQIDGDKLDIDYTPSNYTPSATPSEADDVDDLTAHLYGIDQELTGGGTKEFFAPVTSWYDNSTTQHEPLEAKDDYPTAPLEQYDIGRIWFHVPNDFTSITDAVLVVITDHSDTSWNADIYTSYAAHNEDKDTHSASDTSSTYNVNSDQIEEFDISGLLSSLAAGDYVAVKVENRESTYTLHVLGVRFRYS
jgi:hypothetical protein